MDSPRVKQLKAERASAHYQAVELLKKSTGAGATVGDRDSCNRAWADVDRLSAELSREMEHTRIGARASYGYTQERGIESAFRTASFAKWMRGGLASLNPEERKSVEKRDVAEGSLLSQIGSYSGLGFFIPAGFVYQIEQSMKWFAPLMNGEVFRVLETATGQPLPYPVSDDTSHQAALVTENSPISEDDPTANHVNFGAYKYSSGIVAVPVELMQDSAFDLESWLAELFGIRYGRAWESVLTNGSGSSQPTGLIPAIYASGVSPVIAAGSSESSGGAETGANSVGYSDLVNLEHSVDPAYRREAKYMLHDLTLSRIKRILDKFGRPLWAPGIKDNEPDTLNGYEYVINQAMPQIAAGATVMAFGSMKLFVVRRVKDFTMQRLDERFAEKAQVGFISHARIDSNLAYSGSRGLNVLQMHS